MFEGTGKVRKHQRQENLGAQTAGAVCRTIPARFQLQEVSVGLESSKLRRRPAGRRQLQEALHNSSPAAAGNLGSGKVVLQSQSGTPSCSKKTLRAQSAGTVCRSIIACLQLQEASVGLGGLQAAWEPCRSSAAGLQLCPGCCRGTLKIWRGGAAVSVCVTESFPR